MNRKKCYIVLVLLLTLTFSTQAFASISFSSTAINASGNALTIATLDPNNNINLSPAGAGNVTIATSGPYPGFNTPFNVTASGVADATLTTTLRAAAITGIITGSNPFIGLTGINIDARNSSSSAGGDVEGISSNARLTSTGSTANLFGIRSIIIVSGAGSAGTIYGFSARSPVTSSTGLVTTAYGFRSEAQKTANVATAYGFYQAGATDLNVFEGTVNPLIGLVGVTTNSSASAGIIGEIVSSAVASGASISLTTNTTANVTSVSLTAGDWDVEGNVNYTLSGATATAFSAGITSTTATVPSDGTEVYSGVATTTLTGVNGITLPRKRFSLSGTTTVFLVARSTFTAGTEAAFGSITARRVR